MRRYLVVANQTLGGDQLVAAIRERMGAGPSHFHLLVPATPAAELDEVDHAESSEDLGRRLARERLAHELAHLRGLGADASGEVGVSDPVEAVGAQSFSAPAGTNVPSL